MENPRNSIRIFCFSWEFLQRYKRSLYHNESFFQLNVSDVLEALLCTISIIQPDWINEAREEWKNDEEVWELIQKFQHDSSTCDTFSWKNDLLWYKDRLYLCKNSQLKQNILMELHKSVHTW